MQSGGAQHSDMGFVCDGFCEGNRQLASSEVSLLVHTFFTTLLWMGCQSCGCACQEGGAFKGNFNWSRETSLAGPTSCGPLHCHPQGNSVDDLSLVSSPPVPWVLRSGNSKSFSDIESK